MEPLRKCQHARFFMTCDEYCRPSVNGVYVTPCEDDPPCAYCHVKLSSCAKKKCQECLKKCRSCGALRMRLYDLPERGFKDDKLKPPAVSLKDFEKVMQHSVSSVAESELDRFVKWTTEFGQEG